MPSRRPGFVIFACLLLVTGLNAGRAGTDGNPTARTATTSPAATREARRAAFGARAKQSFTKIVHRNFPKWDENGDGRLSADEIDRLVTDPSVNSLEAAAVAAIHQYLRSTGAPPAVTQADLLKKAELQRELTEQGNSPDTLRHDLNDGKPRFLSHYALFAMHLKQAPRDLFTGGDGPTLDGIKQGALGDCYFMCVIGATVSRDSQTVRRMLRANRDGTTDVIFPSIKAVRVPRLTDSEIALTSSAADQGIWINVLEKAFGQAKYAHPKTQHSEDDLDLDVISRGGKVLTTIQLMTGHKTFVVPIRKYKNKKYHLPTETEIPRTMARLNSDFSKAFATNRLVCAEIAPGVPGKDIPPGLVGRHAYAVLGYDQRSHTVTVWNPHGKDFMPKKFPTGLAHGYPVKSGVFQIPLDDFVRVFKSVTYETSAPLGPARTPKRAAHSPAVMASPVP